MLRGIFAWCVCVCVCVRARATVSRAVDARKVAVRIVCWHRQTYMLLFSGH